jgi:ketosteroid isomerase-like protein
MDVETIEALKQLKARYFYHLDRKDWAAWREVFTEDAVMDLSFHFPAAPDPSPYIFRGVDEIVKNVTARLGETVSAHHGHDPMLEVASATEASGIWAMEDNLFMPDGKRLTGYGHYHESYRRIGAAWRISRTRLTRLRLVYSLSGA